MRLDDGSDVDIEDQRGSGGGFGGFGGGGIGSGGFSGGGGLGGLAIGLLPMLFSRLGCFGTAIVIGLFVLFSGRLGSLTGGGGTQAVAPHQTTQTGGTDAASSCAVDDASRLSCNVLSSVNNTWAKLLPGYKAPKFVFYAGSGRSGCGAAQSAMGPFYCPADNGVYLDTEFYDQLKTRFGAPGDFAQGYVIAHEVGHHVQNLTGIADRVAAQQQSVGRIAGNALQVKMELQADCYAGVWAANARNRDGSAVLEVGDIEEGLRAAAAIGDDTLQRESQGRVSPDSFTHGSSAQRQMWLKRGLDTGDYRQCDTFNS